MKGPTIRRGARDRRRRGPLPRDRDRRGGVRRRRRRRDEGRPAAHARGRQPGARAARGSGRRAARADRELVTSSSVVRRDPVVGARMSSSSTTTIGGGHGAACGGRARAMRSGRCLSGGLGGRRARRRWRCAAGSCWRRPRASRARRSRRELGCNATTVGKWRGRFARRGLDGLHDEPRPGKPRSISDEDVERVIVKTLEEQPAERDALVDAVDGGRDRDEPDARSAGSGGRSGSSRIRPRRSSSRPDPQFIDKVRDIVGLYLNPPEAAVVLCVDEKSQIQALDRTAPVLPLMPGRARARQTHDYVRNGTTNLYAALDVASGQVIAEMTPRHRAEEFRRFLNLIDASVPARPRRARRARQLLDPQDARRSSAGSSATRASRSTSRRPTAPG